MDLHKQEHIDKITKNVEFEKPIMDAINQTLFHKANLMKDPDHNIDDETHYDKIIQLNLERIRASAMSTIENINLLMK